MNLKSKSATYSTQGISNIQDESNLQKSRKRKTDTFSSNLQTNDRLITKEKLLQIIRNVVKTNSSRPVRSAPKKTVKEFHPLAPEKVERLNKTPKREKTPIVSTDFDNGITKINDVKSRLSIVRNSAVTIRPENVRVTLTGINIYSDKQNRAPHLDRCGYFEYAYKTLQLEDAVDGSESQFKVNEGENGNFNTIISTSVSDNNPNSSDCLRVFSQVNIPASQEEYNNPVKNRSDKLSDDRSIHFENNEDDQRTGDDMQDGLLDPFKTKSLLRRSVEDVSDKLTEDEIHRDAFLETVTNEIRGRLEEIDSADKQDVTDTLSIADVYKASLLMRRDLSSVLKSGLNDTSSNQTSETEQSVSSVNEVSYIENLQIDNEWHTRTSDIKEQSETETTNSTSGDEKEDYEDDFEDGSNAEDISTSDENSSSSTLSETFEDTGTDGEKKDETTSSNEEDLNSTKIPDSSSYSEESAEDIVSSNVKNDGSMKPKDISMISSDKNSYSYSSDDQNIMEVKTASERENDFRIPDYIDSEKSSISHNEISLREPQLINTGVQTDDKKNESERKENDSLKLILQAMNDNLEQLKIQAINKSTNEEEAVDVEQNNSKLFPNTQHISSGSDSFDSFQSQSSYIDYMSEVPEVTTISRGELPVTEIDESDLTGKLRQRFTAVAHEFGDISLEYSDNSSQAVDTSTIVDSVILDDTWSSGVKIQSPFHNTNQDEEARGMNEYSSLEDGEVQNRTLFQRDQQIINRENEVGEMYNLDLSYQDEELHYSQIRRYSDFDELEIRSRYTLSENSTEVDPKRDVRKFPRKLHTDDEPLPKVSVFQTADRGQRFDAVRKIQRQKKASEYFGRSEREHLEEEERLKLKEKNQILLSRLGKLGSFKFLKKHSDESQ